MKTIKTLIAALVIMVVAPAMTAQTADEILDQYFENTGGVEAWNKLEGVKMSGSVSQGMEIPVDMYQLTDGRQVVKINIQGQELTQGAFDGDTMWGTNFMTMMPEKSDAEAAENMKRNAGSFPTPFLNYKEKGFDVEYLGKETQEGTEVFKMKLTMKPILVDGKEEPNVSFFYFDTENYVPIMMEAAIPSGEMKGQMSKSTFSDYQEVDGLYFPFSMGMGGVGTFTIKEITLNPEVDPALFAFPEDKK
ncbi:MAG: outer membrane lipoprotein-sorting protein [Patiriisocius sp.]|uniref:outer membrane lipoprotein-sorting protein n=1 Tax=Patiriisocius sp. TaxID=2822396 RepID=UPI003EF6A595